MIIQDYYKKNYYIEDRIIDSIFFLLIDSEKLIFLSRDKENPQLPAFLKGKYIPFSTSAFYDSFTLNTKILKERLKDKGFFFESNTQILYLNRDIMDQYRIGLVLTRENALHSLKLKNAFISQNFFSVISSNTLQIPEYFKIPIEENVIETIKKSEFFSFTHGIITVKEYKKDIEELEFSEELVRDIVENFLKKGYTMKLTEKEELLISPDKVTTSLSINYLFPGFDKSVSIKIKKDSFIKKMIEMGYEKEAVISSLKVEDEI